MYTEQNSRNQQATAQTGSALWQRLFGTLVALLVLLPISAWAGESEPPASQPDTGASPATPTKPEKTHLITRLYVGYRYPASRESKSHSALPTDAWVPLHLYVDNTKEYPFKGILRYAMEDRRDKITHKFDFERSFAVPPKSTHHITTYVYIPKHIFRNTSNAILVNFTTKSHGAFSTRIPLGMNLIKPKVEQASRISDGSSFEDYAIMRDFILVFSKRLPVIPQKRPAASNKVAEYQYVVAQSDQKSLASSWIGYSGVDTILIDQADFSRMDATRAEAIREYVQSGGHLVVTLGENRNTVLASAFKEMLPCTVGDQYTANLGDLVLRSSGLASATATEIHPKDGATIVRDGDKAPLCIRGDFGAGQVTVLGFSLLNRFLIGISKDQESAKRWAWWLDGVLSPPHAHRRALLDQPVRTKAFNYLQRSALRKIPTRSAMAILLFVYFILLVPGTFFLFRWRGRLELAWLIMPIISIAFFIGSYYMAFRDMSKNLTITDVGFARIAPSGRGAAHSLSIVHNPTYNEYDLAQSSSGTAPSYLKADWLPLYEEQMITRQYHMKHNPMRNHIALQDVKIPFNDKRVFESEQLIQLGQGLHVTLKATSILNSDPDAGETLGTVTNQTGHTLHNAALLCGDRAWLLESIGPGESMPLLLKQSALPLKDGLQHLVEASHGERFQMQDATGREAFFELFYAGLRQMVDGERRVFLVAMINESQATWSISGKRSVSNGVTLLVFPGAETKRMIEPPPLINERRQFDEETIQ